MTLEDCIKLEQKRNRGKAAVSEHALQTTCVRWFRYVYPHNIIISIPNGAKRSVYERRIALEEGLTAGVPDLFIPHPVGAYHGLWIEMKNGKAGRLTDSQKQMITRLPNEDYYVEVCHTIDEFVKVVEYYMNARF